MQLHHHIIKIHHHYKAHKEHYNVGFLIALLLVLGFMRYPYFGTSADSTGDYLTGDDNQQIINMVEQQTETMEIDTGSAIEETGSIATREDTSLLDSGDNNTGTVDILSSTGNELTGTTNIENTGNVVNTGSDSTGNNINTGNTINGSIHTGTNQQISNNTGSMINTGNIGTGNTGNIQVLQLLNPLTVTLASLNVSPNISGYVGLSGIVHIKFSSTKELSGIQATIYGRQADNITKSGLNYMLDVVLTKLHIQGSQNYYISYQDLDSNTGSLSGITNIIFDKVAPDFTTLQLTGNNTGFIIQGGLSENSLVSFVYSISGDNQIVSGQTTGYNTGFSFNFSGAQKSKLYKFSIYFADRVNNMSSYSGVFYFDSSGTIQVKNMLIDTGYQELETGDMDNGFVLLQEIRKFNECKAGIKYKELEFIVKDVKYTVQLPEFQKDNVRKFVAILSYMITNNLNEKKNVDEDNVKELFKRLNNFFIVFKLVRDDGNTCQQNLSSYHTSQFKRALKINLIE